MKQIINTFDIDGVIFIGWENKGVRPHPNDVIVTGRSYEETKETLEMLRSFGIDNMVIFNHLPFDKKTRETSGDHKANTIRWLIDNAHKDVRIHFEDDEIQAAIIERECPEVTVVRLVHSLTEKENKRQEAQ